MKKLFSQKLLKSYDQKSISFSINNGSCSSLSQALDSSYHLRRTQENTSEFINTKSSLAKLLFRSLQNNNTTKQQRITRMMKNRIFVSKYNIIENNLYNEHLRDKLLENFPKINNQYSTPLKVKDLSNKDTVSFSPVSNMTQKIQDEIFSTKKSSLHEFTRTIKNKIIINDYIKSSRKKYMNEIAEREKLKKDIYIQEKIIQKYQLKLTQKKGEKIDSYLSFLHQFIETSNIDNQKYIIKIETLKSEVKELFLRIKMESDNLKSFISMRNFLICVRESISLNALPIHFTFYSNEYIYKLMNIFYSSVYVYENESLLKKDKEYIEEVENKYRLPTNLIEYMKQENKERISVDKLPKNYLMYLNLDTYFKSIEEFHFKYLEIQGKVLKEFEKLLNIKEELNKKKQVLNSLIKINEKEDKMLDDEINKDKQELDLIIKKNELLKSKKNEMTNAYSREVGSFRNLGYIVRKIEKGSVPLEFSIFILKFHQLLRIKKIKMVNGYVYYYIAENVKKLYAINPELFHKQNVFDKRKFNKFLNTVDNCDKYFENEIKSNCIYLLVLYENACTSFKEKLHNIIRNNKAKYKEFIQDMNAKKIIRLTGFQKDLTKQIAEVKRSKIIKKQNKQYYRTKNLYFIKPVLIDECKTPEKTGKKFDSKDVTGEENTNSINFSYNSVII